MYTCVCVCVLHLICSTTSKPSLKLLSEFVTNDQFAVSPKVGSSTWCARSETLLQLNGSRSERSSHPKTMAQCLTLGRSLWSESRFSAHNWRCSTSVVCLFSRSVWPFLSCHRTVCYSTNFLQSPSVQVLQVDTCLCVALYVACLKLTTTTLLLLLLLLLCWCW